MIETSNHLGQYLGSVAGQSRGMLTFDTHYDAQNWELSWWSNRILHRLDFQPIQDNELAVTHYKDQFRLFPRLLRWAHGAIPMFPYMASVQWRRVATERFPIPESRIMELVADAAQQAAQDPTSPPSAGPRT